MLDSRIRDRIIIECVEYARHEFDSPVKIFIVTVSLKKKNRWSISSVAQRIDTATTTICISKR